MQINRIDPDDGASYFSRESTISSDCNCEQLFSLNRPLQFNYLSYKLFLEKKFCQTQKKKSRLWCLTDESGLEIFYQTAPPPPPPPKKKVQVIRIFIVRVIQSTAGIHQCCSRASDLRMYTSHPSGYWD